MSFFNANEYRNLNIYSSEIKPISIVEHRGVAGSQYMHKVEIIIENVKREYQKLFSNKFFVNGVHIDDLPEWPLVDVNSNKATAMDFADNIYVRIVPDEDNYGVFDIYDTKFDNRKMTVYFSLHIYKHSYLFDFDFFFGALYHEMSHCADSFGRMKDGSVTLQEYLLDKCEYNYAYITKNATSNPSVNIEYLIYRLFIPTEINALSSQLFGELCAKRSKRENYKRDLTQTEVWAIYTDLRKFIFELSMSETDSWTEHILKYCMKNSTYLKMKNDKERAYYRKTFKIKFIKRAEFLLRHLLWSMNRAAETYYLTLESIDKEKLNEELHLSDKSIKNLVFRTLDNRYILDFVNLDIIYIFPDK